MKVIVGRIKSFCTSAEFEFLLAISTVFAILRIPSLVEPDWYGDEGIYQVIGMALKQGRFLYREIWDNKPPMLYLIYSVVNGDLFYTRLLSLISGIISVIFIFFLAKKLFKKRISIYLSTTIFAILFSLPLIEGNIANAENFMLAPIILSALLILSNKSINYFLAGLLLSFAFLTKIVAVFDFAAFFIVIFFLRVYDNFSIKSIYNYFQSFLKNKKIIFNFKDEMFFAVSFVFPIILVFVFFTIKGAFNDFYTATFSQNVGYVGYGNYFIFPMGRLILKLILLFLVILIVIIFRSKLGKNGFFIFIWLMFSLFNCLFSERPYTHYMLVLLPSFCLFIGYLIENKKLLILNSFILVLLLVIILRSFNLYAKIFPYYSNYINFIINNKSAASYEAFFDRNTPRDYLVAEFIKANTNPDDYIFLWSDSGQIYKLSNKLPPGRYIVSYHITFYKDGISETKNAIDKFRPKYIIATKQINPIYYLLRNYGYKLSIKNASVYERQF